MLVSGRVSFPSSSIYFCHFFFPSDFLNKHQGDSEGIFGGLPGVAASAIPPFPMNFPDGTSTVYLPTHLPSPIGSMYGIFTYIWLIFMVNVGKYTIHGSYGSIYPSILGKCR